MSGPEPRRPLSVLTWTLPEASLWFRVHHRSVPPERFVVPRSRNRWSPFGTPPVPALYAAASPEAALAETVFRDLPPTTPATLPMSRVVDLQLSVLRVTASTTLALFADRGLQKIRCTPEQLTSTPSGEYERTIRWAGALHADTSAAGICWMTRHWNTERSIVLFADRADGCVEYVSGHESARDYAWPDAQEELRQIALSIDVTIDDLS